MIATADIHVRRFDRQAVAILRRRSTVDLELGETLLALSEGDRLLRLGYSKLTDYGRERLGLPARTLRQFTRLARGLQDRPVLRRAVASGEVSMRKALIVMEVAVGESEAGWAVAAARMTERELVRQIRAGGGVVPEPFDVESVTLRMDADQQDRLEDGIETARVVIGEACAKWIAVEAIAMEYLGSTTWDVPADGETVGIRLDVSPPARAGWSFEPAAASRLPTDARELDARAHRLMEIRVGFDTEFGPVLRELKRRRAWAVLGFASWAHYLRDRLGISPRSARQRIWLERKMDGLPELRAALQDRVVTYTKALFVAKDASPDDVGERIAAAAATTLQQVERESDEKEARQNRAAGVRRLWGPKDAFETISLAIRVCQEQHRARGEVLPAGEALARMADHFVSVWREEVKRRKRNLSKARLEVMARHGGLCAFPGCTRPAGHDHHVRWRSRGGSDEPSNRVPLCPAHHLRTIHGRLAVLRGAAGVRLAWRFGSGEQFVTIGDDEVVRVA